MREVLRWIDRHKAGPSPRNSPIEAGADVRRPICWPASSPLIPVSSQVSGPPPRVCWPPTAPSGALASTSLQPLDLEAFCDGANTLYICSAGRRQRQFAPLVVGIIGDVRDAAYARSAGKRGRPRGRRRPTLLALDEVANIAPIPDLPSMVSEGAGQGLLVLACLQDLSQARGRWGQAADGFLSLFGTTVVLRGHRRHVDAARHQRAGGRPRGRQRRPSAGRWADGAAIRPSTSVGPRRARPRLPVDAIARGAPGRALVLGPDKEVQRSRSHRPTRMRRGVTSCPGTCAHPHRPRRPGRGR